MQIRVKVLFLGFVIVMLTSCGGGGAGGGNENWGIDQNSGVPLPVCNGDQNSTTNAMIVKANQTIKKIINPTVLRIWHYQSGEKKACVVQGKAVIDG